MAIPVTISPNAATWSLGDAPLNVSIEGQGNTAYGSAYLWESNSGTFANRFAGSTTFTPNNATKLVYIIGRRVMRGYDYLSFVSMTNATGGTINTYTGNLWNSYAYLNYYAQSFPTFYEIELNETNTEKAMGFLADGTYKDPTIVSSNPNQSFTLCWHFYTNGTAVGRKQGTIVTPVVQYKTGDLFRINIGTTTVEYIINGVVVKTVSKPAPYYFYAFLSNKSPNASTLSNSYLPYVSNEGFTTLNVLGVFPLQPHYGLELGGGNITVSSTTEDGNLYFRKRGNFKRAFSLQFINKSFDEFVTLNKFWKAHEKHQHFMYKDLITNQNYIMRFESELQSSIKSPDDVDVQATIKEI